MSEEPKRKLLVNRIRTPDGSTLISRHVHDRVCHKDNNGFTYCTDGGTDYLLREYDSGSPEYEDISVYTSDSHVTIRSSFAWGTRGESGREPLSWVLLKDLDTDHICNILNTQKHLKEHIIKVFEDELSYRGLDSE